MDKHVCGLSAQQAALKRVFEQSYMFIRGLSAQQAALKRVFE
jgi:hypothetical protein